MEDFGFQSYSSSINSGLSYQGVWDADTNSPFLQSSIGVNGIYYIVNVAGSTNLDGNSDWSVGDWAIFNGTTWEKIDNSGISYQGNWDALNNVPFLQSSVGNDGHFYIVDVDGNTNLNGISVWKVGDWAIFTGGVWLKIVNSGAGITEINTLTATSQLLVVGNNGTDFNIFSDDFTHTFNLPDSSALNRGALTRVDWTTFNNKQDALTFGDITDVSSDGISIIGGIGAVIGSGVSIAQQVANGSQNGYLSFTDWNTFNSKQNALTTGNITNSGAANLIVSGGTGAIIGSGVTLNQKPATSVQNGYLTSVDWITFDGKENVLSFTLPLKRTINVISINQSNVSSDGYLSSTDWTTFNNKQNALTFGNLTDVGTDGISIIGGTNAVIGSGVSIAQQVANGSQNGYLSSANWTTFNNKQNALTFGNITDVGTDGITITGGTGAVIGSGVTLSQQKATSLVNGYLSSTDWATFNGKQNSLSFGNLTEITSSILTITGGTGAVIGSGTSIQVKQASSSQNGFLTSTDWTTFNGKQNTLTIGNITDVGTDGISVTGGTGAIIGSGVNISQSVATASANGYLSSTDWSTFNNKQAALGFTPANSTITISTTAPLSGGGNLTANRTLAISLATTSVDGYLSSTNWNTFNNKSKLLFNNSTAPQSISAATVTYLTSSNITTANIVAGTIVTWQISVTKTAAGTATPIFTVRFGTTSSTSDSTLLTFTGAAQTAAIDTGMFTIQCTFRTVGSGTSAVLVGHYTLVHQLATTGLSVGQGGAFATSAGFDSTTANAFLGITLNSGASAVWTVNQVNVKIENINL